MIMLHRLLLLVSFMVGASVCAQERSGHVAQEIGVVSGLLRSQPPEVAMLRIDSLLALPAGDQDPRLRMGLHYYRGHALRMLGRLDEALDAHTRSYELADSLDDHKGRIDARIAISLVYMDLGQLEKAHRELLDIHAQTLVRPTERNYRIGILLGHLCELQRKLDSALHWFTTAQRSAVEARDSSAVCEIFFNKGVIYRDLQDAIRSEEHLLGALAWIPRAGYPQLEGRVHQTLASLYLQERRYQEVTGRLDRAFLIAKEHGAGDAMLDVMADRTTYFLAVGDTASALANNQRHMLVKDSLSTLMRDKALAEAEARFGVTRMEEELALTKAEAEVNALRAQRSRIAWGALALISVLAAILIFNFRKQYLAKKKAALVLEQDKERLSEENEMLQQENLMARFETLKSQIDPHFLFNAMNTLYTLVETEPAKAREFVSSFSALYRKVLTSREHTIVPVKEELELVRHYLFLQRIRFGDSLRVEVNIPADKLHGYLPPFTLQMLLENAIKHNVISAAHPLHIHLGVEHDRLVVRNDLRPRGGAVEGTGTGLENIRRRYALLGAPEPGFALSDAHYTASVPILSHEA